MPVKTHSEELLRQLSTSVLPVEDAERTAARRDRIVTHLASLVQSLPARRQRRRRLVWAASFSCAGTVALALGLLATRPGSRAERSEPRPAPSAVLALEGSVHVIHRAVEVVALPLERVPVGNADEVVTGPAGRARASLGSGAEVDIDPESRVRLRGEPAGANAAASLPQSGNEAIVLGAGRVTVRVPKLGPARTFAVETPEATVVVRGTAFSVERYLPPAGALPRTVVEVTEGSVAVRHRGVEVLLQPGDRWSSTWSAGSEVESPPTMDQGTAISDMPPGKVKSPAPVQRGSHGSGNEGSSPDKSSSLAEENRLLQTAMAARQQGDARRAAQLAAELVARYPRSPLVEEARVERMRALVSAGGATTAAGEARAYLSDYPQGFARQEANRILAGTLR